MRRLRDFQRVRLHVGAREIDAHVVAVAGGQATLMVAGSQLRHAATLDGKATLNFTDGGHVVALAVQVLGSADGLVSATARDYVCEPEARRHPRVPIVLHVMVTPTDPPGKPIFTTTIDLSEGGIRVRGIQARGAVDVFMRIPGGTTALNLTGRVTRSSEAGTVIVFTRIGRENRARLRDIVLAVRRRALQGC